MVKPGCCRDAGAVRSEATTSRQLPRLRASARQHNLLTNRKMFAREQACSIRLLLLSRAFRLSRMFFTIRKSRECSSRLSGEIFRAVGLA